MDEQMQLLIVLLVQAAMLGDLQANQLIEQIMLAAQQGDQLATLIALMILQVAEQLLGLQAQMAKFGAKLNYIKYLRNLCPEGYEMQSFKKGGAICKKCIKKKSLGGVTTPTDTIGAFKCGRKMKKKSR